MSGCGMSYYFVVAGAEPKGLMGRRGQRVQLTRNVTQYTSLIAIHQQNQKIVSLE